MFFSGFPGGGFPGGMPGGAGGRRASGPSKDVDTTGLYESLGLDKSSNPNPDQVKKAYRKLAVKHHPDKGGDAEVFKNISKAYEILSDPEKKELYDQHGEAGVESGGGGGDPTDIFDMMFGGGGGRKGAGRGGASRKEKTKNVTHRIDATLEQLYKGFTKKLAVNRNVIDQEKGVSECKDCNGQGMRVQTVRMGPMITQTQAPCGSCGGKGRDYSLKAQREVLEVFVEKGSPDEHEVTFRGKADEQPGKDPGDVVFQIHEKPHDTFRRNKADLIMKKKISLMEALCGVKFELEHLDGRKLIIKTKPGEVVPVQQQSYKSIMDSEGSEGEGPGLEWTIIENCDLKDSFEDAAAARIPGGTLTDKHLTELKKVCKTEGHSCFVFDSDRKAVVFKTGEWSAVSASSARKKGNQAGKTLYIAPDPNIASASRMRKAVIGEGMPVFKNHMLKGNLFIEMEIDFPKSLDQAARRGLRRALHDINMETGEVKKPAKGKKKVESPIDSSDEEGEDAHGSKDTHGNYIEKVRLENVDPVKSMSSNEHFYKPEEDDDDQRRGGGGGGVQCQQQ